MKPYFALALSVSILGAGCASTQVSVQPTVPPPVVPTPMPVGTHGMSQYVDSAYGFSFWYPSALQVTTSTTPDRTSFPGGTVGETLLVGQAGTVTISVVDSPNASITDEPNGHASPISQTKYFFDTTSATWMVAFPEGKDDGSSTATTTADISKLTIGKLPMLPSGRRFDTTIIPLGTTRFLVISDGGGSSFTNQLAQTVTQVGTSIPSAEQESALNAEADAYANQ